MGYRFGQCELVPERREVLLEGRPQPVEPQVFDLLLHLVEQRDRVVSHDELIQAIWGGRSVSDSAVSSRISAARAAIGDDGSRQAWIKTVPRRGFRFVGALESSAPPPPATEQRQRIAFCRSDDGTRIAYAASGHGYPLVRAGHWLTHLEQDWHSPVWRPFLDRLNQDFQVLRYDQRGNGLSDWEVGDFALPRFREDLEAVVAAAGAERFALYATSQGVPLAIAYACRHPGRVSHLVLHGGYAQGRLLRGAESERQQGEAMLTLIRQGWGRHGSPFIKAFSSLFIPDGTREQIDSLADLQRQTTSAENAVALRSAVDRFDVTALLAELRVPTLVLHARDDAVHPLEEGRRLAAGIADAEFVLLESANHVILPQEPAWVSLFEAITRFVLGRS